MNIRRFRHRAVVRRPFQLLLAAVLLVLVLASAASACGTSGAPGQRGALSSPSSRPSASTVPSQIPVSCQSTPQLPPVSPTPTWPTGPKIADIFNAVPAALAAQYPTVYGGIMAAPAQPDEPIAQAGSHFVILETVRDPALEAEATAAYPPPVTVSFQLAPYTLACLHAVRDEIATILLTGPDAHPSLGTAVLSVGLNSTQVIVGIAGCDASSAHGAQDWLTARWGRTVQVLPCQKPAVAN